MEVGAATQASLKDLENLRKKAGFCVDCRIVLVNIILKLVEKTPMRYSVVFSSTWLALKILQITRKHSVGCLIFKRSQLKLLI